MYTYCKPIIKIYFGNKLYKRLVSTNSSVESYKITGNTRHFPFATKEWKDSVYTFNKNSLKHVASKDKLTNDLIKSYFTINNYKNIARSRRMRSLILRSSSKRIFLSKPEIKQTNDKIIVTIYTYNREKQALIRKLYFFNRKQNIYNLWLNNRNDKKRRTGKKKVSSKRLIKKQRLFSKKSLKRNLKSNLKKSFKRSLRYAKYKKNFKRSSSYAKPKIFNKRIPYNNISFKNETDFLRFRFINLYRKFFILNNSFMLLFLRHLLSAFNIRLFFPLMETNRKNKKINNLVIKSILNNKPKLLIVMNYKLNNLKLIKENHINLKGLRLISSKQKPSFYRKNSLKTRLDREKLNNFLWHLIKSKLINSNIINNKQILLLFIKLKNAYFKKIITKYFRRKIRMLNYFTRLEVNKLKFNVLLNNLKNIITKIYDKKTELNIVNLKYFHMNSDIYTKIVAKKLTKKVKALKVLRYSFKSVKLPRKFTSINKNNNNINDFKSLSTYGSLKLTELNTDHSKLPHDLIVDDSSKLNSIFVKLFPNSAVHLRKKVQSLVTNQDYRIKKDKRRLSVKTKVINVLNIIKYKWIKGIKVAIAGRLTRRNTAARALKKYITKGNLNDTQYYIESNDLRVLSKVMIRNNIKANLQYTSLKSKRRTGAFGVKSWISSH